MNTVRLHCECWCVQILICLIDKKTGEKTAVRPRFIKQDQVGVARLEVNGGMICLETFKDFPQMGRFTLRDEGQFTVIAQQQNKSAVLVCICI